jgi:hypothetical protein
MYELKVRCNNCESIYYEDFLIAHQNGDDEICPVCNKIGCIMDLPQEEFPELY